MEQMQLPLMCRLDAPSVVPDERIRRCATYREAVQACWELRHVRNMTRLRLAEDAGLYPSHVSCYLSPTRQSRNLPAEKVPAFERSCGNTFISQWLAGQSKLTVMEELQASRRSA